MLKNLDSIVAGRPAAGFEFEYFVDEDLAGQTLVRAAMVSATQIS